MPSNPVEYMPEGLRRQIDKCLSMKKEAQQSGNSNLGLSVIFPPCGLENADFSMSPSLNQVEREMDFTISIEMMFCKFYA